MKNNSKLNTVLLLVLIVLAISIIWILWRDRKAEEGKDAYFKKAQTQTATLTISANSVYGDRYPAGWVIWKEMINGQEVEKIGPSASTKDYLIKLPSPLRVSLGLNNCVGDSEIATCAVGNNPEIKKAWEELNKYQ